MTPGVVEGASSAGSGIFQQRDSVWCFLNFEVQMWRKSQCDGASSSKRETGKILFPELEKLNAEQDGDDEHVSRSFFSSGRTDGLKMWRYCPTISLEEFVTVDDNVCTAPIMADKYILEFVSSSKNIIDADNDDENEKNNNAAPVPRQLKIISDSSLGALNRGKRKRNRSLLRLPIHPLAWRTSRLWNIGTPCTPPPEGTYHCTWVSRIFSGFALNLPSDLTYSVAIPCCDWITSETLWEKKK
ncbi:hypothetical protein TNCV_2880001 [Trichonephila clavipes]|uniref:Uncharacterized protein n=1 Tax=Trichonephila clavipes TaxID=2585209 RepID=A0A8X7BDP7_TRICX|nr:hypothetical protein TNCV_2880001 [Trichonephila clavipes]